MTENEYKKEFLKLIEECPVDELVVIYETEKDLYTAEELELIRSKIPNYIEREDMEESETTDGEVSVTPDNKIDFSYGKNFGSEHFVTARNSALAALIMAIIGLMLLSSWRYGEFGVALLILSAVVFVFTIKYLLAKEFEYVAKEKGYYSKRYFWYAFILDFVGYLLVIALPKRNGAIK